MVERLSLDAVRGDERSVVVLEILDAHPAGLVLSMDGDNPVRFEADNLFSCLCQVRLHFERAGWLLCCQGARPDVWPSGLLVQMSNGREAYHMIAGRKTAPEHIVNIFDPADPLQVSTVAAQNEYIKSLFRPILDHS